MRQREGLFFTPKHSHEKFFRKFFQNYPKRLFADFLARICDEGKGCLYPAHRGGASLSLWTCWLPSSLSFVPLLLRLFVPCWLALLVVAGRSLVPLSLVPSVLVGLLGCGLPCIRLNSAALGAPGAPGHLWTMGALRTGAKRLKIG